MILLMVKACLYTFIICKLLIVFRDRLNYLEQVDLTGVSLLDFCLLVFRAVITPVFWHSEV